MCLKTLTIKETLHGWENFNKPLKAVQIISIDNDFRFMILLSRIKDLLIKDIKSHVIK